MAFVSGFYFWVFCGCHAKMLLGYVVVWLWRLSTAYLSYLSHSTFRTCFELKRNLNKAKKSNKQKAQSEQCQTLCSLVFMIDRKNSKEEKQKTEKQQNSPSR